MHLVSSNKRSRSRPVIAAPGLALSLLIAAFAVSPAQALTISTSDTLAGNRSANLLANGSFENGNSGTNVGWTPGSHIGGYPSTSLSIPNWTASYPDGAYGWWGPLGFAGASAPDGTNMVYFGNWLNSAGAAASVAANGVITFAGTPTFSGRPAAVTLSQTVTGLEVGATYRLDFWTSGEDNLDSFVGTGLFGLGITGQQLTYLLVPASSNSFGASQRYNVEFVATSATTTISFSNWGHITDISGQGSELVLDDVILNRVGSSGGSAAPDGGSSLALFAAALLGVIGARRTRRPLR